MTSFTGRVARGDQRGRKLGFPTANIRIGDPAASIFGVYAGRVDGRAAAISIGVRPTFGDKLEPILEAHILDFDEDIYGQIITVELITRLRGEARFESVNALVAQMHEDIHKVRDLLGPDSVV